MLSYFIRSLVTLMFEVILSEVVDNKLTLNVFISFLPVICRFLIANSCKRDLCVKQQGTDAFERLPVGQHCHLHWTDMTRCSS